MLTVTGQCDCQKMFLHYRRQSTCKTAHGVQLQQQDMESALTARLLWSRLQACTKKFGHLVNSWAMCSFRNSVFCLLLI